MTIDELVPWQAPADAEWYQEPPYSWHLRSFIAMGVEPAVAMDLVVRSKVRHDLEAEAKEIAIEQADKASREAAKRTFEVDDTEKAVIVNRDVPVITMQPGAELPDWSLTIARIGGKVAVVESRELQPGEQAVTKGLSGQDLDRVVERLIDGLGVVIGEAASTQRPDEISELTTQTTHNPDGSTSHLIRRSPKQ